MWNQIELIYNITFVSVQKVEGTYQHQVYLASSVDKKKLIIKVYDDIVDKVQHQIILQEKLSTKNLAPKVYKTISGQDYTIIANKVVYLQEYIYGTGKSVHLTNLINLYMELSPSFIHGDLRPDNVINTNENSYFIDFEYVRQGNRSIEILKYLILEHEGKLRKIEKDYKLLSSFLNLHSFNEATKECIKEVIQFKFLVHHISSLDREYIIQCFKESALIIKTCLEIIK
ncbi:phosphotransferase [Lactobacillus iners]|uniref:phosphotransferase n=1 Tax=Lactobacillus iners TaxID=147802 RepID=UPI001F0933C0|nr:phosphotransferase [Lactobacillus iners]